jgi:hypothetical protein
MKRIMLCLAAVALLAAPAAMACPPVDDGSGSFSSYGADACEAPMVAGNFGGGGYGGGAMFAAPSYSSSFAAPVYSAPVVQRQVFAAPSYGYGASFSAPVYHSAGFAAGPIRMRNHFRAGFAAPAYGFGGGFAAPVRVRSFAAPIYGGAAFAAPVYGGAAVVAAPVVAVPVRAVGPIRGAVQGFFGGVRNRLNGF